MKIILPILIWIAFFTNACEKVDVPKGTPGCIKTKIKKENDKCLSKVLEYTY